jgi:hypothetical protein
MTGSILVIGGSGLIGETIIGLLECSGNNVTRATRTPLFGSHCFDIEFNEQEVYGAAVIFSFDFTSLKLPAADNVNVVFLHRVLERLQRAKIGKVIYISTMTAFDSTISNYGRIKLECEKTASKFRCKTLRVGLPDTLPVKGLLSSIDRLSTLIPLYAVGFSGLKGGQTTTSMSLLARAIELIIRDWECYIETVYSVVDSDLVQFNLLLSRITGKPILALPWKPLFLLLRLAETLGIRAIPFRSDSLLGLANSPTEVTNRLHISGQLPHCIKQKNN